MIKIKHERTADCVVAGYRVHKTGPRRVGSLLLGLYDDDGVAGSTSASSARSRWPAAARAARPSCSRCVTTFDGPPVGLGGSAVRRGDAGPSAAPGQPVERRARTCRSSRCGPSGWSRSRYDHMEGGRFRHTAQFVRWRPDRDPRSCTYDQLERPVTYDLADLLGPS